ncbi:MAG: single-stranded-DNA-specific exonuclease RecJ [Bacillaceae bacterium]
MLKSKKRWKRGPVDQVEAANLASALHISPLVASLLVSRGVTSVEAANQFINDSTLTFHDPYLFVDMEKAVSRIKKAIDQNEKILIFGDYDADGVTSTSIMMEALQQLGAIVDFYIPNRFTEGYGPNEAAFRQAYEAGVSVIITVDTGISALHEMEVAKELGIDVILTDHHEPQPTLPDVYAMIHPKVEGSGYPFHELCGAGVAFKLAHALLGEFPTHLLELATIGTIADLMPLVDENRAIVKRGLQKLQTTSRSGIAALCEISKINQSSITEESIGFSIGPRINAVGRLADADPAVHLLMTRDRQEAQLLAEEINEYNVERQALVNKITEEAIQMVQAQYPVDENYVLVVAGENWNPGVVGIVASRLVDRFYRPTIVLCIDKEKGIAKGSARSIEGFDLFANLSTCRECMSHFGGHPMAAGMTVYLESIDQLRASLNSLAKEQLTEEDLIPVTHVDIECKIEDITVQSLEQLRKLAPFGVGNKKPVIQVSNVTIDSIRQIGADKNHLKISVKDNDTILDTVGFHIGSIFHEISPHAKISLIGEVSINEWNNIKKPQMLIQDVAIADWQLFDYRGRKLTEYLPQISADNRVLIAFSQETIEKSNIDFQQEIRLAAEVQGEEIEDAYVVLLDLPASPLEMEQFLLKGNAARIYLFMNDKGSKTFNIVSTRDHFRWYYAFLKKNNPFSLTQYGNQLCQHKGWTKDTVNFMTMVFFELEFVTIENGVIFLNENANKKDLTMSKSFLAQQSQIQVENLFLYATYSEVKEWFQNKMTNMDEK